MRMLGGISRSRSLLEHVYWETSTCCWRACGEMKDQTRWQRQLSLHACDSGCRLLVCLGLGPWCIMVHGCRTAATGVHTPLELPFLCRKFVYWHGCLLCNGTYVRARVHGCIVVKYVVRGRVGVKLTLPHVTRCRPLRLHASCIRS
jgi:hypothetical protein